MLRQEKFLTDVQKKLEANPDQVHITYMYM